MAWSFDLSWCIIHCERKRPRNFEPSRRASQQLALTPARGSFYLWRYYAIIDLLPRTGYLPPAGSVCRHQDNHTVRDRHRKREIALDRPRCCGVQDNAKHRTLTGVLSPFTLTLEHITMTITDSQKDAAVNAAVTLNGKPARIVGRLLACPLVVDLTNDLIAVEFCWSTVLRVISNRMGAFRA